MSGDRYFARAYATGWGIIDTEQGEFPTYRLIESLWIGDYDRDWNTTQAAAIARAVELNKGASDGEI
jgi:hypothetical protein